MKRSKLKNIINKANELKGTTPFERFKNSLPIAVGDDYRLEDAWKFYGKPKTYQDAIREGLIMPNSQFASVGYNEETEEFEYLNKGRENDTVAKDIRVWDNDVIPLVKELKQGGYIRTFNEEKDCWIYSRPIEEPKLEIDSFLKGGKTEKESKNPDEMPIKAPSSLPSDLVKLIYNSNANFAKRLADPYRKVLNLGEGEIGTHKLSYVTDNGKVFIYPEIQEINGELVDLSSDWRKAWELAFENKDYVEFPSVEDADWFTADNYKKYFPGFEKYAPQAFKQGGQMTTIPSGSLHARKNRMELAEKGEVTSKGIPVIDNDGNQLAEIERNEVIFNHSTTTKIEELYKKFSNVDKESEKDEIAIKVGKILTDELINNTQDNTGLILEIAEKNNLEYNK